MKKLLIGALAVVLLVVVVLAAAPFFIPVDVYKQQIVERTRDATGRELTIGGELGLSLLPRFELRAEDVAFANAPGASEADMATLKELVLRLQILPLLALDVKVDSFVLVEPVIHLEIDKKGRPNWQFDGAPGGEAEAQTETGKAEDTDGKGAGLAELSLGDVRLENGLVTYRDARSGQAMEVSAINMTVSLPDLASPFAAKGSLVWNGEQVTLTAEGDNPRRLMAGEATPVELAVESKTVDLSFAGRITLAEAVSLDGKAGLDVPSIRDLAAWTGNPIEAAGTGLGPLKIAGQVKVAGPKISFSGAEIALDEMKATGDITVDTGRARPRVTGRLDLDLLDLNPYLPPPAEGKADKKGEKAAPAKGAPGDWSDEPIDLSGLKAADVDFGLTVGGIRVQDVKVGRSALAVSLKGGLLVADLEELNLYDGKGKGKITVDGRGQVPAVRNAFTMEGISAEPLLTDAAKFDRLAGTGQFEISVSTQGKSERAMVEALNGKGAVKFVDGAIKGVNLAAMVRNVKSAFVPGGAGDTQKTDFAELSGTFRIENGILRNDDLKLLNPLIRLAGAGTSDLPKRRVDYRVEPKVVGSLKGQGAEEE
ncbi:MAG: AsmA family protein, partial [Rhodospirillales bacterium]|nr:AsmA family protein [Rhodospirillales bacterium]